VTKLAIFGDSFAAPVWQQQHHSWAWPNRLARDYITDNHACIGTGPDYALEKFLQYTEKNIMETHDTCVIFVCSDVYRLNLKDFWDTAAHQVHIFGVADRSIKHTKHMFVRDLFRHLMTPDWGGREQHKIVSTVNSMSHLYKRVLFWPAVELYPIYTRMLNLNIQVPETGLFNISKRGVPTNVHGINDKRVNHFEPDDHDRLYNMITQWIQLGWGIDTSILNPTTNT
jgi:hypothetical protein